MPNNIKEDLALFNELVAVFLEEETKNPVAKYIKPVMMAKEVDVKLTDQGIADSQLKKSLKKLLLRSTKSSSKMFFNQLFGGRHSKAVLGDLLAVMLNNSMLLIRLQALKSLLSRRYYHKFTI